jgi:hypothetical protein
MNERNFLITSPQLFCFVLFYLLSGMMLFSGGSFFAVLFAALFSVCICVIAAGICKNKSSSSGLYRAAFGCFARPLRLIAAFFSALSLAGTIPAFSASVQSFHAGEKTLAFAPALALFCIFGVSGSFSRAARFSELCVFALAAAAVLALFGGGDGVDFAFGENALFSGFDAIGATAVFFSLYLRCVSPESEKMSDFARNSAFHPSPLAAGVCAALASPAVYAYFCFAGNNILFALFSWFFMLARLLLFAVAMADLLAYPEKGEGAKCALIAAAFCAFWLIFGTFFGGISAKIQVFAAVILPCVIFVCSVLTGEKSKIHEL